MSTLALLVVAGIALLALAACGSESQEAATQPAAPEATAPSQAAAAPASAGGGSAATEAPAPSAMLAAAFELPSGTGGNVSLASFAGDKNVVLVFYRGFW